MHTITFGQGDAVTEIPDDWCSTANDQGATILNPPNQEVAYLWLSTASWQMPNTSDLSPADFILQRAESQSRVHTERHADFIIIYFTEESIEEETHLDIHQFHVAPTSSDGGFCTAAFLTLSIHQSERDTEFVRQVVAKTWEIARKVTFTYDTAA